MRWTASQRILLTGAVIVFCVQLPPHWWTGLLVSAIAVFYPLFVSELFLLSLDRSFLTLVAWVSVMEPTSRRQSRHWLLTFGLISVASTAECESDFVMAR